MFDNGMKAGVVACTGCGKKNRVPVVSSGSPVCAVCKTPLPWLVESSRANVDAALDANVPVLVDLWAPWCGPCRMIAPIVEQLARDRAGQLKIVKVNVDEMPQVSARYNVQGIPTLLLLERGREVGRQVGAASAEALTRWLDSHVAPRSGSTAGV
jgi:thioredoxin 2